MRNVLLVLVVGLLTSGVFALHGRDSNYCTTPTVPPNLVGQPTKTKPKLTNQFSADIECVMMEQNATIDMHEWFDDLNNRGAIQQMQAGEELDGWYDYNVNEFLFYFPKYGICQSTPLSTSSQRFLFGYNSQGTTGHIFSAAQALRFDTPATEVYTGQKMVRGILVDVYSSCQYWDIFDATTTVEWYFSASQNWNTAVGIQVPVGIWVKGRRYDSDTHFYNIEHNYNIFHYRPDLDDNTKFETPDGVQCAGRVNTATLPSTPNAFSVMVENIDEVLDTVSYMQEYFDDDNQIVRYAYRPSVRSGSRFGQNDLVEIHDFNTGVAYVTDQEYGNCTAMPIERSSFDVIQVNPTTVRIRSSREFFYFDVVNFTYEGVKTLRDINCNTWVGVRPNWPRQGVNSTWQWWFATDEWTEVSTGTAQGNTPISLRITAPQASINYVYNFFNFDAEEPNILKSDISACYEYKNRRKFQMQFPASYIPVVSKSIEIYKYFVLVTLAGQLSISPLRVANLQVFLDQTIVVTFELLDVAPAFGDVSDKLLETDLATAANTLVNLVNTNQFFISMNLQSTTAKGMIPIKGSFIETTYLWNSTTQSYVSPEKKGYKAGVMAAVGVVVPIASAALGAVLAFVFFK